MAFNDSLPFILLKPNQHPKLIFAIPLNNIETEENNNPIDKNFSFAINHRPKININNIVNAPSK